MSLFNAVAALAQQVEVVGAVALGWAPAFDDGFVLLERLLAVLARLAVAGGQGAPHFPGDGVDDVDYGGLVGEPFLAAVCDYFAQGLVCERFPGAWVEQDGVFWQVAAQFPLCAEPRDGDGVVSWVWQECQVG